jgi:transposase-like protein
MKIPDNQLEFEKMFTKEEQCLEYLFQVRFPDGYICPRCDHSECWVNSRGLIICQHCKYELSFTAGTIFHNTKLPLTTIFRALWWIVAQKNGVSAVGLQRVLGLGSYRTAWTWLHKFRRLMVIPGREKLSEIVEIDETYVGGKSKGKRGRGAEGKSVVAIAVEVTGRGTGRVRLDVMPDARKKTLFAFIEENIEPGSTITTDDWRGYKGINLKGYDHKIEIMKVKSGDEELLANVHRVASLLKRWLIGTHQNYIGGENLKYYLDEYTFRYNRRKSKSRGLLFYRLIEQAVVHSPVQYKDIIYSSENE